MKMGKWGQNTWGPLVDVAYILACCEHFLVRDVFVCSPLSSSFLARWLSSGMAHPRSLLAFLGVMLAFATTISAQSSGQVRIMALGDSITGSPVSLLFRLVGPRSWHQSSSACAANSHRDAGVPFSGRSSRPLVSPTPSLWVPCRLKGADSAMTEPTKATAVSWLPASLRRNSCPAGCRRRVRMSS